MVLLLDGHSEIGAHVRCHICYFICLRNLKRSRAVTNRILILRKDLFSFMRAQHALRYHLIKYLAVSSVPQDFAWGDHRNIYNFIIHQSIRTWYLYQIGTKTTLRTCEENKSIQKQISGLPCCRSRQYLSPNRIEGGGAN